MSNRILPLARSAARPGATAVIVNDWPWDGTTPPPPAPLPSDVELVTIRAAGRSRATRYLLRLSRPLRVLRALRHHGVRRGQVAAVCLPISLMSLSTWLVVRLALRCPIVVDALERHDPEQFPHGRLTPHFLRHRWTSMLGARLADRVITVSSTLGRRFAGRRRPVLVVPPQVDCDEYAKPDPPSVHIGLRLLYAGTPGAKDRLDILVEGLTRLSDADRARIELRIAGAGEPSGWAGPPQVTFLGRIPRSQVLALLARSHFSLLVRPVGGYAEAGFPSKVPESLAAGCPVLLNHTSDLNQYIVDGREGIVLAGPTADDVADGLRAALALDDAAWLRMSGAARVQARVSFDYRGWVPAVADFLRPPSGATASSPSRASTSAGSR
jgi:glycosyltransferase involved in cell wall biosynthesis